MMSPLVNSMTSLPDRLATFQDYWNDHKATARQLAALGHVYDGFAALEEGSYCISCNAFVKRADSIAALEGPMSRISTPFGESSQSFTSAMHHSSCIRLQMRIPLDTRNIHSASDMTRQGSTVHAMKDRFEPKPYRPESLFQYSSLSVLPTELRLEIYAMAMPVMDPVTEIVTLNRESSRIITKMGFTKTSRRNTTKCNILLASRAVYDDAHDILFASTTYKFDSTRILYLFLRNIGGHGRQLLKSVDVVCGHREDAVAFSLLATCPQLRSMTIRLAKTKLLPPNAGRPIWIVDGLASLLELSGLNAVTLGECKDRIFLEDNTHDAGILRRELTRPKGTNSGIRWVNGMPDL